MEHNEAIKSNAIERYILGEMSETERDNFEEHFFACRECAREVQMTEIFRANLKAVFEDRDRGKNHGQAFYRRAFSIAAGLLLAMVSLSAYQNWVTIPQLSQPLAAQFVPLAGFKRGDSSGPEVAPGRVVLAIDLPWRRLKYRVQFQPECGGSLAGTYDYPSPGNGLSLVIQGEVSESAKTCGLTLFGASPDDNWEKLDTFSFDIIKKE